MAERIPEGWCETTLHAVTQRVPNVKPETEPRREFGYVDIASIDRDTAAVATSGIRRFKGSEAPSRARRPIQANDVLFSNIRTNLRNVAHVAPDLPAQLCSTGFTVLRPKHVVLPQYLLRWVLTDAFTQTVSETQTGTHYPATSDAQVLAQPIRVAPLAEQRRIVEKVEALLERVNQARSRLAKVPLVLKAFRRAVLAAACSGRLTEKWRALQNHDTGASAIEHQLKRHRGAWERRRDRSPSRARAKYERPPVTNKDDLPDLPGGWQWVRLGFLGEDPLAAIQTGPFGTTLHSDEFVSSGVPVIAVGNLTGLGFTTEGLYFITQEKARELERFNVNAGDLLFARSGATLGKVCVAPEFVQDWRMTGHILRARLNARALLPELAAYALRGATPVLAQVNDGVRGVTRPGYNTSLLEDIHVPLPPFEEQVEIVRRIKTLFAVADTLEERVAAANATAGKLPRAILEKAFSGELVPTEAELARAEGRDFEPASVLLGRVQE